MSWQISDKNGVIYTGTEQEMTRAWFILTWTKKALHCMFSDKQIAMLEAKYKVPYEAPLKLQEIRKARFPELEVAA